MKLITFLLAAATAFGQAVTPQGPATVSTGTSAPVSITLSGNANPAMVQFSLNVKADSATAGPASTAAGKQLACAQVGSQYNCVVWGLNTNTIADGVVATVNFTPAASGRVSISSQLGASAAGAAIPISAGLPADYTVVSPTDINGDGKTDGADANALLSIIQQQMATMQKTVADLQLIVLAILSTAVAR